MDSNSYPSGWEPNADYTDHLNERGRHMQALGDLLYSGRDLDTLTPGDMAAPGVHHDHGRKFSRIGHHHDTEPEDDSEVDEEGNPKTINWVFARFAERTSMTGLPFIYTSKLWAAKLVWTVLFLGGFGAMCAHLNYLTSIYLEYGTTTTVSLGFSRLQFPAVTVCNVNPIRTSMLYMTSDELQDFVKSVSSESIVSVMSDERLNPPDPNSQDPNSVDPNSQGPNSQAPVGPQPPPGKKRKRRDAPDDNSGPHDNPGSPKKRVKRFINGFTPPEAPDRYKDAEDSDEVFTGNKSTLRAIEDQFKFLFTTTRKSVRESVGHQIDTMLMECTFRGVECDTSTMRLVQTAEYGNCYTIENNKYVSSIGGPNDGLSMILFLEDSDYLDGITSSLGVQVHVHAKGAWPNPYEEGVAVAAGAETFVGLKKLNVQRESMPYGDCVSGGEFEDSYNVTYTQKTCQVFCVARIIIERCGCFDSEKENVFRRMYRADTNTSFCASTVETACMLQVISQHQNGFLSCTETCKSPCEETLYDKQLSSHVWPSSSYSSILVEYLCGEVNETVCEEYATKTRAELATSFLKLVIYFEDLNYENITEQPDYEVFQFASDIGGTIGLWIGLSLISAFEVLQFIYETVLLFVYYKPKQAKIAKQRKLRAQRRLAKPALAFVAGLTASSKARQLYAPDDTHDGRPYTLPNIGETSSDKSTSSREGNKLIRDKKGKSTDKKAAHRSNKDVDMIQNGPDFNTYKEAADYRRRNNGIGGQGAFPAPDYTQGGVHRHPDYREGTFQKWHHLVLGRH